MRHQHHSRPLTRRTFVKGLGLGAAAAISVPFTARSYAAIVGSNEAIKVGVIGVGGRGREAHAPSVSKDKGFRLTALCDADEKHLEAAAEKYSGTQGFVDLRKLLDSKDIDAVTIATPNHWHSLAAIWAIQAGKDVYCEKPVSHNVSEGRRVVEFARKYDKMVQAGTQSRSSREGIAKAVEYVRGGKLGKIKLARGLCYKRRDSIGKVDKPIDPPPGVNFDVWCGPAEMLPIRRKNFHYDWHWVWNTGNGDIGNQGIHEMDVARWFLGESALSPAVLSIGGRVGYIDDGETPNTMVTCHSYPAAPLIFEVRGLPDHAYPQGVKEKMDNYKGVGVGIVIECEGGYVVVPSYGKAVVHDNSGKELQTFADKGGDGTAAHFANWQKACRSRKYEDLYADILQGHLSSALCHTSNISYRLGQQQDPEAIEAAIKSNAVFTESYERMKEHLAKNNVDISKEKLTLGAPLTMDPQTETFPANDAANALLTRKYRSPYVVPDKVA
jgi:predicted dehydrogenase